MREAPDIAGALLTGANGEVWAQLEGLGTESRAALVGDLVDEVRRRLAVSPPEAQEAADVLLRVGEALPEHLPFALRTHAGALHLNAKSPEARAEYERAIELFEARGDLLAAAQTRRNLVDVLQILGDSSAALLCAEAARTVLARPGNEADLAKLENNVGNVYVRLDEYPAAREHYRRARVAFLASGNELGSAVTAFNLAVVEQNANDCAAAERLFREAREGLARAGRTMHVADCDYSLAYLESRRGRFAEAIDGLERARRVYEENKKPSGPPLCDLDLAEIFLRLDACRNALELAESAAAGFRALELDYETARSEILAGLALMKLGSNAEALDRLERAAGRFRNLGNEASAAAVEVQKAAIEIDAGEATTARGRLARARSALTERGMRFLADLAGVHLARAHLAAGDPGGARRFLETLLGEADEDAVFDLLLRADALALLARARRADGDPEGATEALQRSVDATEEGYAGLPSRDIRIAFFRDRHLAYVDLVWDLADHGTDDDRMAALSLLEHSRGRSLLEESERAAPKETDALREARAALDWMLSRRLDQEVGPATGDHELRLSAIADAEIRRAQDEVLRLASSDTGPSRSAVAAFEPAELDHARGGDVLCLYVTGPRGARVFLADEGGLDDVALPTDEAELAVLQKRLDLHISRLRHGRDYVAQHRAALERAIDPLLARFGDLLLEPIRDTIAGRPLAIVPFGALHDLPFHAFHLNGEPLVASCDVGYALSARTLAVQRTRATRPDGELLCCGVSGGRLQNIEREIAMLAEVYPGATRVLDADALVEHLAGEGGAGAGGVLHLAAHSVYLPRRPVFSAVCLGERFLLAHDLQRMRLDYDLVVLSGCETGRKRRVAGEEFFGLSRALFEAGARSVLGSLWAVDDADALAFMTGFYRALADGSTCRAAVALSQRELLGRGLHPSSWASFTLLGAPDTCRPARQ